ITTPGWVLTAQAADSVSTPSSSEFSQAVVVQDLAPPTVSTALFKYDDLPQRLVFAFSEDLWSSLMSSDLTIQDLTAPGTVPTASFTHSPANTVLASVSGIVPDHNFRAVPPASGFRDLAGNPLDGNADGTSGDDYTFDFFFLMADANHDRFVNTLDFNILA